MPLPTYTRPAFWTVDEYRSTVVVAPPSSCTVIRPMFGPLVATTAMMLPAEYARLGDFALSPDSSAQRTEPPHLPALLSVVHVPPQDIWAEVLSVGVSVNR